MEPFFLFIIFIFVSTGKAGRAPQILRVRVSFPTYKPGRRTAYRGIGTYFNLVLYRVLYCCTVLYQGQGTRTVQYIEVH